MRVDDADFERGVVHSDHDHSLSLENLTFVSSDTIDAVCLLGLCVPTMSTNQA